MTNAERILLCLDQHLTSRVELTLYGRAALTLGFTDAPAEYALSRDVDAVLWVGQAESLLEQGDFWEALERVNHELADTDLYVSHLFTEDQVILLPDWRAQRVALPGPWAHLTLFRLGDLDLLLSKLMRDDPVDHADACFIVRSGKLTQSVIADALRRARLPDSPEVREQFAAASARLMQAL